MYNAQFRTNYSHVKHDRSDTDLIQSTLSGDRNAFTHLVMRYERTVAATIMGMLGRGIDDGADEVGQQVFIRFYEALPKFRGESSVKTYLTRIAINLSLNELQRRKREQSRTRSLSDETFHEAYTLASDDGTFDTNTDNELVAQAMKRLSEDMRQVVVLRLINGFSSEETAEMLNIPVGTVLSRLSIARKKLRELLSPYFGDDYGNE